VGREAAAQALPDRCLWAPGWEPPVDLYETADGLTLCVALPGVAADELEVFLESGTVVVRGERAFPVEYQRAIIYRLEFPTVPSSAISHCPPASTSSSTGAWRAAA